VPRSRQDSTVIDVVQILGSLLILAAFGLSQGKALDSRSYLILNIVGSAILGVLALNAQQWGFLLLEGVWTVVSAISFVATFRTPVDGVS
jgi:hypothetical protein